MSRHEWEFELPVSELADACKIKSRHHTDRLEYWKIELQEAEEALKTSSIQVKEYDVTGGKRRDLSFDPSLKNRFNECEDKIEKHKRKIKEFERYHRALGSRSAAGRFLNLTLSDWEFFGL